MTIGIAIPIYIEHIKYLDRLLDSIEASTVKPAEVSVSMSECDWTGRKYSFKLLITQFDGRRNVAQNRNVAISRLTTDIISVVDGDDMVHPQRNEFILEAFKFPDIHAVVHNFEYGKSEDDFSLLEHYDHMKLEIDCIDTIVDNIIYPICKDRDIRFGNPFISCRKEVFYRYDYNESREAEFTEDSLFNRQLVLNGYKISYIENKLVLYIKNPNRKL